MPIKYTILTRTYHIIFWRKMKLEAELQNHWWKIEWNDVMLQSASRSMSRSRLLSSQARAYSLSYLTTIPLNHPPPTTMHTQRNYYTPVHLLEEMRLVAFSDNFHSYRIMVYEQIYIITLLKPYQTIHKIIIFFFFQS